MKTFCLKTASQHYLCLLQAPCTDTSLLLRNLLIFPLLCLRDKAHIFREMLPIFVTQWKVEQDCLYR